MTDTQGAGYFDPSLDLILLIGDKKGPDYQDAVRLGKIRGAIASCIAETAIQAIGFDPTDTDLSCLWSYEDTNNSIGPEAIDAMGLVAFQHCLQQPIHPISALVPAG